MSNILKKVFAIFGIILGMFFISFWFFMPNDLASIGASIFFSLIGLILIILSSRVFSKKSLEEKTEQFIVEHKKIAFAGSKIWDVILSIIIIIFAMFLSLILRQIIGIHTQNYPHFLFIYLFIISPFVYFYLKQNRLTIARIIYWLSTLMISFFSSFFISVLLLSKFFKVDYLEMKQLILLPGPPLFFSIIIISTFFPILLLISHYISQRYIEGEKAKLNLFIISLIILAMSGVFYIMDFIFKVSLTRYYKFQNLFTTALFFLVIGIIVFIYFKQRKSKL